MLTVTKHFQTHSIARLEGIPMSELTHKVTLTGVSDERSDTFAASIDGQPAELRDAINLIQAAKKGGTLTLLGEITRGERPQRLERTIDKPEAAKLHRELAQMGVKQRHHKTFASETLDREVTSFTQLTVADVRVLWSRVRGEFFGEEG